MKLEIAETVIATTIIALKIVAEVVLITVQEILEIVETTIVTIVVLIILETDVNKLLSKTPLGVFYFKLFCRLSEVF